ncbi:SDR family NAD(P)-dependent oxidoreductase [Leucobacter luti]|uniref:2-deoxy-D-gluconate 3-dehydrogenase n=1 Tax=Leucobacter luti TaxID=340320 RepID=A0A4Q7U7U5_9MICO|nr:SDR family oxidoreductase [Leucobacter luti]MBL3700566.1 SDR family oxidoreductase [Leucobacter luti]RZT68598.1 2-deoxy-D-gluconate 3-dehydrogenase [Leucobacter luti]
MIECTDSPGLVISGHASPVVVALASLAIERGWRVAFVGTAKARAFGSLPVQCHTLSPSDPDGVESVLSQLSSQWRRAPAALVYATHAEHTVAAVTESVAGWRDVQRQLGAAFLFAQAGVREMLRLRGGAPVDDGAVVFLGDASASRGIAGLPRVSPGAAAAGLAGMTRQLAVEWGPFGVRVNLLRVGLVAGEDAPTRELAQRLPLGRAGTPEEIAETCYYLISRSSSYVTGVALAADGGFLAT